MQSHSSLSVGTEFEPFPGQRLTSQEIRTLALASLGSALEFYDFIIFVFFTPIIAQLFFPASMPAWLRQLETFGLFAAGYVVRPLGGIVMAHSATRVDGSAFSPQVCC